MKINKLSYIYLLIFLFLIAFGLYNSMSNATENVITFDKFRTELESGNVETFKYKDETEAITGTFKKGKEPKTFSVYVPPQRYYGYINTLEPSLREVGNNSEESAKETKIAQTKEEYEKPFVVPAFLRILPTMILIGAIIFTAFVLFQNFQSGGAARGNMNFGKTKAKMMNQDVKKITFNEVAGAEEEKRELSEIVDFIKNSDKYGKMGARVPKGVLLVGPPGTGKTLFAKAVAGEAGVPFFGISGSDFVELYVGVGASRVRDIFEQAKKSRPAIIFIDEIDAVGRKRGNSTGGNDEREQTLNQLLVEMDGFGENEGIIMIAATNRADILDSALLRPGRFDRQIVIGRPDVNGREEILKVHARNKKLDETVHLDVLAKGTNGFTGADLENLLNEAALLAVREEKSFIGQQELEEARTRVIAGLEKTSRVVSEHERKLTAYHEAGHAVVHKFLDSADPVHEISIIPRGMAGGYTLSFPKEDVSYRSKIELEEEMVMLLGGRVAEKLVLNDISTGAGNDLQRTTNIARAMIATYGMSDKLGAVVYDNGDDQGSYFGKFKEYSEDVASKIDEEMRVFIDIAYKRAEKILTENMHKLHAVAEALLEKEKLDGIEFERIMSDEPTNNDINNTVVDNNIIENNIVENNINSTDTIEDSNI